jgi:hypothetical protein
MVKIHSEIGVPVLNPPELYLMLMLEWSLMGHLMSGWLGVACSYCLGSICQYYVTVIVDCSKKLCVN